MRTLKTFAACCAVLLLAGCISPPKKVFDERINDSFAQGGGEYTSGPRIFIFAALREQGGQTAVCGAYARDSSDAKSSFSDPAVLEGVRIEHSGQTIMRGVERFPRRTFRKNMRNSLAHCFLTDEPWQAAFADNPPQIVIARYRSFRSRTVVSEFIPGPLPDAIL